MRVSWTARPVSALALSALAALSAFGAAGAARAEASPPVTPAISTSYTVLGDLLGVAAPSASNAWAVGYTTKPDGSDRRPLLLHWNGRAWSQVAVRGVPEGQLTAVTAVSATDVWAVGTNCCSGPGGVVILHWNGKTWSQVTANLSTPGFMGESVAATAHDVWVAAYNGSASDFLHLTGGRWYVVPASLPQFYDVTSVAVVSPSQAWASGLFGSTFQYSFLMRWNGSVWKRVADPMAKVITNGLASGPGGTLWAVGYKAGDLLDLGSVSMRWDGKRWHLLALPSIGGFGGAAFIPGGTAWAAGWDTDLYPYPVIARWTGSTWLPQAALLSINGQLSAVAATSARNAWAVGNVNAGTLILHWNGKAWS